MRVPSLGSGQAFAPSSRACGMRPVGEGFSHLARRKQPLTPGFAVPLSPRGAGSSWCAVITIHGHERPVLVMATNTAQMNVTDPIATFRYPHSNFVTHRFTNKSQSELRRMVVGESKSLE